MIFGNFFVRSKCASSSFFFCFFFVFLVVLFFVHFYHFYQTQQQRRKSCAFCFCSVQHDEKKKRRFALSFFHESKLFIGLSSLSRIYLFVARTVVVVTPCKKTHLVFAVIKTRRVERRRRRFFCRRRRRTRRRTRRRKKHTARRLVKEERVDDARLFYERGARVSFEGSGLLLKKAVTCGPLE